MFKLLWKWLVSIFTADKIGIIVRKLLINSAKTIASDVFNVENQKKAYEFVKELNQRSDIDNTEKAKIFNVKMGEFIKGGGKAICTSVLNCLREMALVAIYSEENHDK